MATGVKAGHWNALAVVIAYVARSGDAAAGPMPRGVDSPVLQEPSVQDYFGFLREYREVPLRDFNAAKGPPVLRVTDMDDETFQQLVRDGSPFVVDDCLRGVDADAISNFECEDFAKRWPTGNMRAEYTPGQYHIYLRDKKWHSELAPQRAHKEHMAGQNKIAGPYIWHVKDEEPLKTKRSVQKHWRTPYFLERSLVNRMEANESFEFWFSMVGGGTFTHADAYCESTISMQFKGKKRWRIQAFPEIRHYLNATSFGDEQIYESKQHVDWTPETEFTVGPGQCFVFPTGYLHETYVDPVDNGNEASCYTASTFQFNHPRQVNLYRAYLSRFSMAHYGMTEPCINGLESYATWLGLGKLDGKPGMDKARRKAEELVRAVDTDGDDRVTTAEIYKYFCVGSNVRKVIAMGGFSYNWIRLLSKAQRDEWQLESLRVWAEDTLQYHDLNRDKAVSVEELASGLLQWHVVRRRGTKCKKISDTEEDPTKWLESMVESETNFLDKFYCKDPAACQARDDLRAYGEWLQRSPDRITRAKSKIAHMFESEDGEGDGEQLAFMDRETNFQETRGVKDVRGEL